MKIFEMKCTSIINDTNDKGYHDYISKEGVFNYTFDSLLNCEELRINQYISPLRK